ncbi:hypothetical protein SAMN05216198_3342 [Halopseudomonas litoralis]|uniref:DUF6933 domain-containing protein n=1 Tax=Halopseudomonas litoralis TaxID=797277 RepID=A0A1H1WNT2_9GAMM|nr:hypothetical protein [Halopseudomonas litoralis]SDS98783.1 hypothetical protein SAMN05216198_3342 [Halopseudomonas litoralis]
MIQLHCTQKLLAKLPVNASGRLPNTRARPSAANDPGESPLSGWHANLLTLQRRNCVLFVHGTTRFPVLLTCLTKPDFAELGYLFQDGLMNTLLKGGASQAQLNAAARALAPLQCDMLRDRSVQGTLNQMKQDVEHMLWYDRVAIEHLGPYSTGAWLAERPCGVKGDKDYVWPMKEMLALLDPG